MNLDEVLSEFNKKFFRNVYIEYGEDIRDIRAFSFNKWGDRLKSAIRWRVDGINKRNLEDLDALYFPDKVQMEGSINCINSTGNRVNKTGEVVPFLDLQSYNEDESIKNE